MCVLKTCFVGSAGCYKIMSVTYKVQSGGGCVLGPFGTVGTVHCIINVPFVSHLHSVMGVLHVVEKTHCNINAWEIAPYARKTMIPAWNLVTFRMHGLVQGG